MRRLLVAIRDVKTEMFLPGVISAVTRGEAERIFVDVLQRAELMKDHPHDFALYEVGSFDDGDGRLYPPIVEGVINPPTLLIDGLQVTQLRKAE